MEAPNNATNANTISNSKVLHLWSNFNHSLYYFIVKIPYMLMQINIENNLKIKIQNKEDKKEK